MPTWSNSARPGTRNPASASFTQARGRGRSSGRPELAREADLLERLRNEADATRRRIVELENQPRQPLPSAVARAERLLAGEEPARSVGDELGTLLAKGQLLRQAISDQEGKVARVRLAVSALAGREVQASHAGVLRPIMQALDGLERVLDEEQAFRSAFRRLGFDSRGLGLSEFKELLASALPALRRLRQILTNMGVE